ncbi:nucleotide-binding protein [Sphingobacterium multivorum]|nr:TIR domain-containing protein [Sphingobacterium multivorum]QQT29431.1 nucleotide-binding protein [Sphingobacterium multivorum]
MKQRIFIGSSAEQLNTLNKIKEYLETDFECIAWTDAFGLNKSSLDSLVKQTRLADFSILLASKDDITRQRHEHRTTPRDNVIFEFGLFFGSAGSERCFLLAEEDADLPSDLDGITVAKFSEKPDAYNALDKRIDIIKQQIGLTNAKSSLGLLPSTALAIGYYNSFIKRVCEELHRTNKIVIDDKEVEIKDFSINVVIPDNLDDDGVQNFTTIYNKKHKLTRASTACQNGGQAGRSYPFHFKVETDESDENAPQHIQLWDVPSTLSTIVDSLKLYLPTHQVGADLDIDYLEKRELDNFAKVLRHLISRSSATKNNVKVEVNVG